MFARTERLLLRPGWSEDAPALFEAIGDERIVRNLAQAPWPYREGDAVAFLARDRDPREPSLLIFLRDSESPRLIGGIGIGRMPTGALELGYWIARPYWGRGFATEAGRAVLANARESLRLRHLSAGHFVDNPASGRVLMKLGFGATGQTEMVWCRARGSEVPCRRFELDLEQPAVATAPAMPPRRRARTADRLAA